MISKERLLFFEGVSEIGVGDIACPEGCQDRWRDNSSCYGRGRNSTIHTRGTTRYDLIVRCLAYFVELFVSDLSLELKPRTTLSHRLVTIIR